MHVDYKTESWQNTMKGRSADLFAFFCAFLCAAPENENKYLCQQLHRSLAARGKKKSRFVRTWQRIGSHTLILTGEQLAHP